MGGSPGGGDAVPVNEAAAKGDVEGSLGAG